MASIDIRSMLGAKSEDITPKGKARATRKRTTEELERDKAKRRKPSGSKRNKKKKKDSEAEEEEELIGIGRKRKGALVIDNEEEDAPEILEESDQDFQKTSSNPRKPRQRVLTLNDYQQANAIEPFLVSGVKPSDSVLKKSNEDFHSEAKPVDPAQFFGSKKRVVKSSPNKKSPKASQKLTVNLIEEEGESGDKGVVEEIPLEREEVVEKMESVSEKVAVKSSPRKSPHKTKSSSPSKSNIEESSKDHDVGEIGVKDPNYVVAVPPTEDQDVLEIPQGEEMCLSGLKFVVTGQLQTLSREALIDLISMYGGRVTGSLSKQTNYVVVGADPGPSKMAKIKELRLKMLNEAQLFDLIRTSKAKKPEPSPEREAKKRKVSTPPKQALTSWDTSESSLWVDKYRPNSIEAIIGNATLGKRLMEYLQKWNSSHRNPKELAVLLSGPPGIGKTTAAHVCAKAAGYKVVEFNASDTRNAKSLKGIISSLVSSHSMDEFQNGSLQDHKTALIMDEVDGMSSGDRGGIKALIDLLKTSHIPVICICNDRSSPKLRSLANYCLDLRFRRPTAAQIANKLMPILKQEGFDISMPSLEKLVTSTRNDIRQTLNMLQFWNVEHSKLSFEEVAKSLDSAKKDVDLGAFDVIQEFFKPTQLSGSNWVNERIDYYFVDQSLVPLMVFDKYLQTSGDTRHFSLDKLEALSMASDSISKSDSVDNLIRREQSFSLMPLHAALGCVVPGRYVSSFGGRGQPTFPQWLGKNSTLRKNTRLLSEMKIHVTKSVSGTCRSVLMDYLPILCLKLIDKLKSVDFEGAVALMDDYGMTLDDFEFVSCVVETYQPGLAKFGLDKTSKTKLSKTYKKLSTTMQSSVSRKSSKSLGSEGADIVPILDEDDDMLAGVYEESSEEQNNQEDDDLKKDSLISQKKPKGTTSSKSTGSKKQTATKKRGKKNSD